MPRPDAARRRAGAGAARPSASSPSARRRAEWTASVRVYVVQSAAGRALGAPVGSISASSGALGRGTAWGARRGGGHVPQPLRRVHDFAPSGRHPCASMSCSRRQPVHSAPGGGIPRRGGAVGRGTARGAWRGCAARLRASASSASARVRVEWTASVRVYVVQSAATRALGAGRRHPARRGCGRTRNSAGRMARVRGAATCLRLLGECTTSRRVDGIRARLCRAVGGRSCTRPGRRHLARRGCGRAGRGRAGARRPRRAGRAARTPRRLRRGTRARPPRGPRRRGRWSGG